MLEVVSAAIHIQITNVAHSSDLKEFFYED